MPKKLILLFSHQLTDLQIEDARKNWEVEEFISLPENLQKQWSNIPPELENITNYLSDIKLWLHDNVEIGDYVLIQGDFGATFQLVNWAFKNNATPIYSTTKRVHIENKIGKDEIEIKKTFQHTIYRKYESN